MLSLMKFLPVLPRKQLNRKIRNIKNINAFYYSPSRIHFEVPLEIDWNPDNYLHILSNMMCLGMENVGRL